MPSETILCASPILDRTGFISKKRTLILTDYPRLICIKELPNKVTLKSEVFLGTSASGKSSNGTSNSGITATGGNGNGNGNNSRLIFIKAEMEGEKCFMVKTVSIKLPSSFFSNDTDKV